MRTVTYEIGRTSAADAYGEGFCEDRGINPAEAVVFTVYEHEWWETPQGAEYQRFELASCGTEAEAQRYLDEVRAQHRR